MATMTSRERVLTALRIEEPDRVPWVESYVNPYLEQRILGYKPGYPAAKSRFSPEIRKKLALDNLTYDFAPPRYAKVEYRDEDQYITEGYLKGWDDLEKLKELLPDPDGDELYKPAREFLKEYKKDYAAIANVRLGPSNTYLSMGIERFSLMIYDDPKLVHAAMDLFSSWTCRVINRIQELELGFDLFLASDDLAFKSGPFISPAQFREFFLPYMKKCAEQIKLPWVYHSCGKIMPIFEDLLSLEMNGICNIEPGPMDIFKLKEEYGQRICLMGNIDLHYTLTQGTPEETEAEVKEKIKRLAPGGGYIIASSNGLANYVKVENVLAMNDAILKYGSYPINIE